MIPDLNVTEILWRDLKAVPLREEVLEIRTWTHRCWKKTQTNRQTEEASRWTYRNMKAMFSLSCTVQFVSERCSLVAFLLPAVSLPVLHNNMTSYLCDTVPPVDKTKEEECSSVKKRPQWRTTCTLICILNWNLFDFKNGTDPCIIPTVLIPQEKSAKNHRSTMHLFWYALQLWIMEIYINAYFTMLTCTVLFGGKKAVSGCCY